MEKDVTRLAELVGSKAPTDDDAEAVGLAIGLVGALLIAAVQALQAVAKRS